MNGRCSLIFGPIPPVVLVNGYSYAVMSRMMTSHGCRLFFVICLKLKIR